MAGEFNRPPSIEFDPAKHIAQEVISDKTPRIEIEDIKIEPRASSIINDYKETIDFMKFLEGLLDEKLKDVAVQVDLVNEPQLAMAIQRCFDKPASVINYQTYKEVISALEEIEDIESSESSPDAEDIFIQKIQDIQFTDFGSEGATNFQDTSLNEELTEATSIKSFTTGGITSVKTKKEELEASVKNILSTMPSDKADKINKLLKSIHSSATRLDALEYLVNHSYTTNNVSSMMVIEEIKKIIG